MSQVRTILLIGRDPFELKKVLRDAGFTAEAGFAINEAGGFDTAKVEIETDEKIVAVACSDPNLHDDVRALVAGRPEIERAFVNTNGIAKVPEMFKELLQQHAA